MKKTIILMLVYLILSPFLFAQEITTPKEFFGFEVGADKKLIDWNQMYDYFLKLDSQSDRVKVVRLGETTENRPFIMAYISSAENISNLEHYRQIQHKLVNCENLGEDEAQNLFDEGKSVVMINASLHATEIGGSQMSPELAYELVSENSEETLQILENVILLLIPSANPDGLQMVVDWYKKYLGTEYEGSSMPYLYHKYVGHDNNRDWYMLTQKETKQVAKVLYRDWFPEIVYDIHQMGSTGARFFVPPFYDIANQHIPPLIFREIMFLGGQITTDLSAKGFKGIATNSQYTMFWHGGMRTAPYFHNMVGLLSEAASVKLATPIEIKFEDLSRRGSRGIENYSEFHFNFPEPWKGGWWHLRDIVEMDKSMSYSILTSAAKNKKMWMRNFYVKNKNAIEKGKTESPFAFVIPEEQMDPVSMAKMLQILIDQGVEVHRADTDFMADGAPFSKGSYVVLSAQPFRPNVIALFGEQEYPAKRQYPGGPVERPYDITGWTLPYLTGVQTFEIKDSFSTKLTKVENVTARDGSVYGETTNTYYLFTHKMNNHFKVLNRITDSYKVAWIKDGFKVKDKEFEAGTGIVSGKIDMATLNNLCNELKIDFYGLNDVKTQRVYELKKPRLGLYKGWLGSMDEGWTRFVLENFEFSYVSLMNERIKEGNLNEDFDVILIPSMNMNSIIEGRSVERVPEEYAGGIGDIGVENLKKFVENGGTLITLGSGCELPIKKFWIQAKNLMEDLNSTDFFVPGSILRIIVDTEHPVGYGMPREANAFFSFSPFFSLSEGKSVARYSSLNPILSGFLLGEKYITNRTALADISLNKGRVILIGFRVQNRAQTWNTYKLLFNSIYLGASKLAEFDKVFK